MRDYGVEGQLGLEPTPEEYVEKMVAVFREVRRVMRDDGTLWLNLGDSYVGSMPTGGSQDSRCDGGKRRLEESRISHAHMKPIRVDGLKPKDLCGIPWRIAFALQADGWYLRSDIIWAKPNPMPESVTDRPSKAHEYVFLMSKSQRYYFDQEAVREKTNYDSSRPRGGRDYIDYTQGDYTFKDYHQDGRVKRLNGPSIDQTTRNLRTVWTIATQPYPEAHFATFPEKLVEPCILAGTSEYGCCPECGAPWERVVEVERTFESGSGRAGNIPKGKHGSYYQGGGETVDIRRGPCVISKTKEWQTTCPHAYLPEPCIVLDPFMGSGMTALVALKHRRHFIGCELNPEYVEMAQRRLSEVQVRLL